MKKYVRLFIIFQTMFLLFACQITKKISLPKIKNIIEINVVENGLKYTKDINNNSDALKAIYKINKDNYDRAQESFNDQPTNIKDYIIIKFNDVDNKVLTAYLYKKRKTYFEIPYLGIWTLKNQIFGDVLDKLNN